MLKNIDIPPVCAINAVSARILFIILKENEMKLTPPKMITFWISVALGLLGLLGAIGVVSAVAAYAFWLAFAGFALLALGLLVKGI